MTESYEAIQAGAKGGGVDEWKQVDRARSGLAELYRDLAEDDTRTDEYKAEKAQEAYAKTKARIEELAPEARQKMLKTAETRERMSIPTPEDESLITKDVDRLTLTAHERSRLEGLLSRSEGATAGTPFGGRNPADILRGEYERGLDTGGPGGGSTVRAVVGLVRDLGLDIDSVVDARRRDFHRSCLEDARKARTQADMVGSSVPKPPFEKGATGKNVGTYSRSGGAAALLPSSPEKGTIFKKKRRPAWR